MGGCRKRIRIYEYLAGSLPCGGSVISSERGGEESLNNGAVDELALYRAERRVLDHQRKLHRWAHAEPDKRFGDLFNLVCDQATLLTAWERVAGNRGARTAGVDAVTRRHVDTTAVIQVARAARPIDGVRFMICAVRTRPGSWTTASRQTWSRE